MKEQDSGDYLAYRKATTDEARAFVGNLVEKYNKPGEIDIHVEPVESSYQVFFAATVYKKGSEACGFRDILAILLVRYNPDTWQVEVIITRFPMMNQEEWHLGQGLHRLEEIINGDIWVAGARLS